MLKADTGHVPASFDSDQCQATIDAARKAGINVENMHDVLLYDFMWVQECGEIPSDLLPLDMEKNVLVFDLGGDNFDELLAADMLKRFEEINGIKVSIKRKEEVMCKLRKLAESRFITGL